MIREITQSTVEQSDESEGYGGSCTTYIVCEVEDDATDEEITEAVLDLYPATRCEHEHDCCGSYYANRALWAFAGHNGYTDEAPRLILITQDWAQNV